MSPVRLGPVMNEIMLGKSGAYCLLQPGEGGGQIRHKLVPAGDDHVMRRQDGQRASAGAAAGHDHAAGLGDEHVAFGDAGVAFFQGLNVVALVREQGRQAERLAGKPAQLALVAGEALPFFRVADFDQGGLQFVAAGQPLEIRLQVGAVFGEEGELFLAWFAPTAGSQSRAESSAGVPPAKLAAAGTAALF